MDPARPQPRVRDSPRALPGGPTGASAEVARPTAAESALLLAATAVLAIAVVWRAWDSGSGADLLAAVAAIGRELPVTLPAAVLVSAAMALDMLAGAGTVRVLQRRPFASWTDAALAGAAGAVVLDVGLVSLLGGIGWFRVPVLAAALVAATAAGATRRPWFVRRPRMPRVRPAWSLLVVAVWCGPVIVALASPVVPAGDVLPNHVAPAEHLRVFGSIATLATYPSPVYGPSRLFLGYEGLFGTLATITGLPAVLAVAVSAPWLAVLTALGARRVAGALFGRRAADWALIAMALSFTFVRLVDVRDSVVALPIAALALARTAAPPRPDETAGAGGRAVGSRTDVVLLFALAAAILVHPLVGFLTGVTVALVAAADPAGRLAQTAPALAGAGVAALPQLAVMVGLAPAPIVGVLALVSGGVAASLTARLLGRLARRRLGGIARTPARLPRGQRQRRTVVAAGVVVGLALLVIEVVRPGTAARVAEWLNPAFPVLFLAAALVVLGPPFRDGRPIIAAGLAAGLGLLVGVALAPADGILGDALRYEVPKAVGYWLPWISVPALAGMVAWSARRGHRRPAWLLVPAAVLLVALVPLGPASANAAQASHPTADVLVWDLRTAELGYWQGYPDSRGLVGASGSSVLGFLRSEAADGRLHAGDTLLHLARSYEPWASIPVAPFTGIDETVVAEDGTANIFTAGGRVHPMTDLDSQLRAGHPWVLLEPAGLAPSVRAAIVAAGYRAVFDAGGDEVFTLAAGSAAGD